MSTKLSRVAAIPLLALTISIAGCAAPAGGPRPQLRDAGSLASAQSLAPTAGSEAWPGANWWTAYGDPQLDALVAEALASSPDVAIAAARIRQAEGAAQVAGAATLPQIEGQGSAGLTKQSYNNGIPSDFVPHGWKSTGTLALSGQFDLDLWGRQRAALAAATSEAEAARVDAAEAALMLSSNVVSSYFDLSRLMARGKALDEAVAARAKSADLAGQRYRGGLDNASPVREANAALAQARGEASANAEQIQLRRHAIAALLGAGPDRGLSITPTPIASLPATPVPADAGIALVGRRPDIVAARRRVEAAGSQVKSARAAFLPDISLRGLIGLTSLGLSNLFDSGSTYGNVGGAFTLPIFEGGRLKGQLGQARGRYDEAVATYNKTVIGGLQDVADALASRDAALVQEAAAKTASDEAEQAYQLAMTRYRGGLGTYIEALVAEDKALAAREAALDAHFRTLANEVALTRALGGYRDVSGATASGATNPGANHPDAINQDRADDNE